MIFVHLLFFSAYFSPYLLIISDFCIDHQTLICHIRIEAFLSLFNPANVSFSFGDTFKENLVNFNFSSHPFTDFMCNAGLTPAEAASLPDLLHVGLAPSNPAVSLYPEQTRPTLTPTCRAHRQTARMNWWVSIRKRSTAPKACGEEPKPWLIPNSQEGSAGIADRCTGLWLLIMTATVVKPQLTVVGFFFRFN